MDYDRPEIDGATASFWQGLADGRLLGSRCQACGELANYPRGFCPYCWSDQVEDIELSGNATLYSYSVVHMNPMPPFREHLPYIAALVDLDEGSRLATRLIDVDPSAVTIGMALSARFDKVDESQGIALFAPVV